MTHRARPRISTRLHLPLSKPHKRTAQIFARSPLPIARFAVVLPPRCGLAFVCAQSFEDMDVRSEYIEGAMNSSTTAAMPEEQVETLMQEVATEHDLKFTDQFATPDLSAGEANGAEAAAKPQAAAAGAGPGGGAGGGGGGGGGGGSTPEDDLEERLRRLRSG